MKRVLGLVEDPRKASLLDLSLGLDPDEQVMFAGFLEVLLCVTADLFR